MATKAELVKEIAKLKARIRKLERLLQIGKPFTRMGVEIFNKSKVKL